MEKLDCKVYSEIDMTVQHVATATVLHRVGVFIFKSRIYGEVPLLDIEPETWLAQAIDMATENVDTALKIHGFSIL